MSTGFRRLLVTGLAASVAAVPLVLPVAPAQAAGEVSPVLVVTSASNPFSGYYTEVLQAEGLNAFSTADLAQLSPALLRGHDAVVLGELPLTPAQAGVLADWVGDGGNLVAMRPDADLAGLLGLTPTGRTRTDPYITVDTSSAPGTGIKPTSMQVHGAADVWALDGASQVAGLSDRAGTAAVVPGVTVRSVGASGGSAAAFTYDLARSVVLTRQGNPEWAGQRRDGQSGGIRSDNLFFGGGQPHFVDPDKIAIPQADEQQRLLANLMTSTVLDRLPLPRFGYLPRGERAAVVMTGDDHGTGGTSGRFDAYRAASPAGCSVEDWECVRGTSYVFPGTPFPGDSPVAYEADGFEVALHPNTGCADYTPASLARDLADQLGQLADRFPGLAAPTTSRTHCVVWSDWVGTPRAELAEGIRLDTNYYYWPAEFVRDRPGLFTGSGLPQRFADTDGSTIDVYQAATQMTDESGLDHRPFADALLDAATGPSGYYTVLTANMHTDAVSSEGSDAVLASALAHDVPVVTARQMLQWLDGRNASTFRGLTWSGTQLDLDLVAAPGARGLQALLPWSSAGGSLTGLRSGGVAVPVTRTTVKGVDYAAFAAGSGHYTATYTDPQTPTLTSTAPVKGVAGTWVTLRGTHLTGATSATFNGVSTPVRVIDDGTARARVPAGATSGVVRVSTPRGTATTAARFLVPPRITSFTPDGGRSNSVVTVTGTGLTDVQRVLLNGRLASFTRVSPTTLRFTVPARATSGPIKIVTDAGAATSASFTVR